MAKHTQEPWQVGDVAGTGYGKQFDIRTPKGPALRGNQLAPDGISIGEARENARRIVACVNACAGIPTEALEAAASEPDAWSRLRYLTANAREAATET